VVIQLFTRRALSGSFLFASLAVSGCAGEDRHGLPPQKGAEDLLRDSKAAAEAGDCDQAIAAATAALDSGLLLNELIDDALIVRARCLADQGKFDDAMADINEAVRGADDLSAVHAARGDVLLLRGDKEAAQKEYGIAKRMNARITVPSELR